MIKYILTTPSGGDQCYHNVKTYGDEQWLVEMAVKLNNTGAGCTIRVINTELPRGSEQVYTNPSELLH